MFGTSAPEWTAPVWTSAQEWTAPIWTGAPRWTCAGMNMRQIKYAPEWIAPEWTNAPEWTAPEWTRAISNGAFNWHLYRKPSLMTSWDYSWSLIITPWGNAYLKYRCLEVDVETHEVMTWKIGRWCYTWTVSKWDLKIWCKIMLDK